MSWSADPKAAAVNGHPGGPANPYQPYPYPPPHGGPQPPPPYYPYVAPPPPPPPYPSSPSCGGSSFISAFFATLLLLFTASLLLHLLLHPQLPDIAVSSAAVSRFNISATDRVLTAHFDIALTLRNPSDNTAIEYEQVAVALLYGFDVIAYAPLPPFLQEKENITTVRARMMVTEQYLSEETARGIELDREQGNGEVHFRVRLLSFVRFRTGDEWWSSREALTAFCENVHIAFANATAESSALLHLPRNSCLVTL